MKKSTPPKKEKKGPVSKRGRKAKPVLVLRDLVSEQLIRAGYICDCRIEEDEVHSWLDVRKTVKDIPATDGASVDAILFSFIFSKDGTEMKNIEAHQQTFEVLNHSSKRIF